MKQKHFYTHLKETTDIVLELGELDLSPEERMHLLSLIDANIHSAVINTVLTTLDEENKKIFLSNLVKEDHSKTWDHLKNNSKNIEEKVVETIRSIKKEFIKDIQKVRSQKEEKE
jgi:hypothetical protein